jgi:DNA-binding beta-propeller fold protein YncE
VWVGRYDGPAGGYEYAKEVETSPDGGRIFVLGGSDGPTGPHDFVTIAYDSWSGATVWAARLGSPDEQEDTPYAMAVDPTGASVFVTGTTPGPSLPFRATTGRRVGVATYDGPVHENDSPAALVVGADGRTVYVAGRSVTADGRQDDFATIAYAA